uniref:Cytochrome P450 n=1 Tax=Globodera rostochiensis TaxID=31243 RepID=A0A914HV64_GLORO
MLLLLLLIVFCALFFYHLHWKRLHLPPGPIPLPFVGNIAQFSGQKKRYNKFEEWTKEFGPIYTIWLGEQPVVIFTDFEMMKQCFTKDEFAGRNFLNNHFRLFSGEVYGIIRTEGELWRQMRKFTLKALRDFGLEKGATEAMVLEAVSTLITEVEEEVQSGLKELSIDRKVDLMTGSLINRMLFGFSFYGERYKMFAFLKEMLDIEQEYFISMICQMIEARPWLRHLPYLSQKYKHNEWTMQELFKFFDNEIQKRVEARKSAVYNNGDGIFLDILDQFIDQVEQTAEQKDADNFMKLKYLSTLCYDLFLAGQETTSNTLNFLILFLMLDQTAQAKLHAELDTVAEGKSGQTAPGGTEFRMADRLNLPYTHAVVNESLRLSNLIPLNLHKILQEDTEIGGHKLKKGTAVVNQIATVLFNEKIFPGHESFIPDRFLDENGKLKKVDELIPFGIGKRSCPGETLGRMELVLFTANFFYKFHIYPSDPLNPPKFEKRQTFAVKLPEYSCAVTIRRH